MEEDACNLRAKCKERIKRYGIISGSPSLTFEIQTELPRVKKNEDDGHKNIAINQCDICHDARSREQGASGYSPHVSDVCCRDILSPVRRENIKHCPLVVVVVVVVIVSVLAKAFG